MSRRTKFVDYSEVSFFVEEMRKAPQELHAGIRRAVREGSKVLTDDMKQRAAWSSRIPSAVKVRVSFAQRGSGVMVRVDRKIAPHGRPFEGMARGGNKATFRHPVFGNREVWVAEPTRPFFKPAIETTRPQFIDSISEALLRALPIKE